MSKPSDMPHRIVQGVRGLDESYQKSLTAHAEDALYLMQMFLTPGYSEEAALELTAFTLERMDERGQW